MQCEIQFQGNKKSTTADLEFIEVDNAPTRVIYNGKTGYLNAQSREVYKDTNYVVLWFQIIKPQSVIPGHNG